MDKSLTYRGTNVSPNRNNFHDKRKGGTGHYTQRNRPHQTSHQPTAARIAADQLFQPSPTETQVTVRDRTEPLRATNMNILVAVSKVSHEEMATALEMPVTRVQGLLDSRIPVTKEIAHNIESQLYLPPGWLDHRHQGSEVPAKCIAVLKGEAKSASAAEEEAAEPESVAEVVHRVPAQVVVQSEAAPAGGAQDAANKPVLSIVPAISTEQKGDKMSEKQIQNNRQHNLNLLVVEKGAKKRLADMTEYTAGQVSLLAGGSRKMLDDFARNTERVCGLDEFWMDVHHKASDVPQAALDAIASGVVVKAPLPKQAGGRGRPVGTRTASEGTDESAAPAAPAAKKAAKKTAAVPAAKKAARKPRTVQQPVAAVQGAASQGELEVLERPAVAAAPAPAPAPAVAAGVAGDEGVSPTTSFLLKLIRERAQQGHFTDAMAVQLLSIVVG